MSDVEATLDERGSRYGDFTQHAEISQDIQDAMRKNPRWGRLRPVHKQALTVIADKIARVISGDPEYADNWHDIQGYARLVEDRLIVQVEPDLRAIAEAQAWYAWEAPRGFTPAPPHWTWVRFENGEVMAAEQVHSVGLRTDEGGLIAAAAIVIAYRVD